MLEMKPGDVRVFKGGKALVVAVGVWAKREREHFRIDVTGFGGHATISKPLPNAIIERSSETCDRS